MSLRSNVREPYVIHPLMFNVLSPFPAITNYPPAHNLNISDAMPLTPIGVTFHNGKVYLYYVDRSNHLHRVIKNGKVWGSPTRVENAPTVAQDSQVAVTTSNNINHIFYVEKEEYYKHPTTPKITHFRDSIA